MVQNSQMARATETRRQRNAAKKRHIILKGAREIFMAHGFGGASMDAIADAASVSKMTLYRYFDGKEALFAGLIEEQCERIIEQDPTAPLRGLPLRESLFHFGERLLKTVYAPETLSLHRIVMAEVQRFPELGMLFYKSGPEKNIEALSRHLQSLSNEGRPEIRNSRKTAEEFFELVRGYTHLRLLLGVEQIPDQRDIRSQVARAVDTVMKGL